jgi:hypothetical protein
LKPCIFTSPSPFFSIIYSPWKEWQEGVPHYNFLCCLLSFWCFCRTKLCSDSCLGTSKKLSDKSLCN